MNNTRFIEIREQCKLPQSEFCKLFGVSFQTVNRWETELKYPELDELLLYKSMDHILNLEDIDINVVNQLIASGILKYILPFVETDMISYKMLKGVIGEDLTSSIQEKLLSLVTKK